MAAEVHGFQTEVSKLLTLLAKSLYSNKEVFLREIISNASDAIDKLRFLSITDPSLLGDDAAFCIRVKVDKDAKTLTVTDNGIGMTVEEANLHLGTIAKSGTADFLSNLSGDQAKDSQLIGQFGLGFYSAFIVADKVTVESRSAKAAANEAVRRRYLYERNDHSRSPRHKHYVAPQARLRRFPGNLDGAFGHHQVFRSHLRAGDAVGRKVRRTQGR